MSLPSCTGSLRWWQRGCLLEHCSRKSSLWQETLTFRVMRQLELKPMTSLRAASTKSQGQNIPHAPLRSPGQRHSDQARLMPLFRLELCLTLLRLPLHLPIVMLYLAAGAKRD